MSEDLKVIKDKDSFYEYLNELLSDGTSVKDRISYLVKCNGGSFVINGWGYLSYDEDGHQLGLEQSEALGLQYWCGFFDGLNITGLDVYEWFEVCYQEYIENFKNERAAS